jgi:branched-chain amino acid transport system substrate-binding protein
VRAHAKRVALLAPDSAYGRQMAQTIAEAARSSGLQVVVDLRYPENATTFIEPAARLKAASPDALFLPAPASQVALIAPQLSSSGLTHVPGVKPAGKLMSLYATCDGLSERFLTSTAKYLQGAVLAPVFSPSTGDALAARFGERYRAAYGEEPSSLDALAFDAVRAMRLALDREGREGGQLSRSATAAQLGHAGESGLTGELAFTPTGERAGSPPLYVVEGDGLRPLK